MKKNKILKITVITLLVILLSIISFGGIFVKDRNTMKNLIPDYKLSRELTGSRRIQLKVDTSKETVNYDKDGNVIEEGKEKNEDGTSKIDHTEEIPANKEEDLTTENYKKSREIFENRLKAIGFTDYTVRLNEDDGTMLFELPDNSISEILVEQLGSQGKIEIVDNETKEVLMTNDDLEDIVANTGRSTTTSEYSAIMQMYFNKTKFREVANRYKTVEDENQNEDNNEEGENEENSNENSSEKTEKKITLFLDDEEIDVSSDFQNGSSDGVIQLSVGQPNEDINSQNLLDSYRSAIVKAGVLSSNKAPVVYITDYSNYIFSDISGNSLNIAIYIGIGIVVVGILYLIIKYKKLGLLSSIAFIGYVALLLLAIRVIPNITISIGGISAVALAVVINYIVNIIALNDLKHIEDEKLALKKATAQIVKMLIPAFIVAIVFVFVNDSFGIIAFWGLSIIALYNYLITKTLISGNNK